MRRMPRTIRFHLDEDVDPAIAEGLRRRGIDVTTTQEVGLLGAPDPIQLAHAHAPGRVLLTHDDDHLRQSARGVEHSGIAYCHRLKRSIGEVIDGVALISSGTRADPPRRSTESNRSADRPPDVASPAKQTDDRITGEVSFLGAESGAFR
jgi:hypothetical protein